MTFKTLLSPKQKIVEIGLVGANSQQIWVSFDKKSTTDKKTLFTISELGAEEEESSHTTQLENGRIAKPKEFDMFDSLNGKFSALKASKLVNGAVVQTGNNKTTHVEHTVELDLAKYGKVMHLFTDHYGGTFLVYKREEDAAKRLQYWNSDLSAITMDVPCQHDQDLKQVLYVSASSMIIAVSAESGELLGVHISSLATPSVAGSHANHTINVIKYQKLTQQFTKKESVLESSFVLTKDGSVTKDNKNQSLSTIFSHKNISSYSDDKLADLIAQNELTVTAATMIINSLYQLMSSGAGLNKYLRSIKAIFHSSIPLEQVPKEQVMYVLQNALQLKDEQCVELILKCAQLLSQFDKDQKQLLPLELLPIVLSNFDANVSWMVDLCNLLIETHFRSIVASEELLEGVKQVKQRVSEMQRQREREGQLKGMLRAFALATPPVDNKPKSGMVLINF